MNLAPAATASLHLSRHDGRLFCRQPHAAFTSSLRLSGRRLRLRLLLPLKHLHHRIPWRGTWHGGPAGQHRQRAHHPTRLSTSRPMVRPPGSHQRRRCDFHGHHAADHHALQRQRPRHALRLPRLRHGLQCTLPCHVLLRTLIVQPTNNNSPKVELTRITINFHP